MTAIRPSRMITKSRPPVPVRGKRGDKGRFITLKSGQVIFLPEGRRTRWADVRDKIKAGGTSGERVWIWRVSERLYGHYGLTMPTDREEQEFLGAVGALPREVRGLWKGDGRDPILAIGPDRFTAYHHGDWTVVPKGEAGGLVAQHEFLHQLVSQRYIKEKLSNYKPEHLFSHADWSNSPMEEDLAMMLTLYKPSPSAWAKGLVESGETLVGGKAIDLPKAEQKVRLASEFLRQTGGW